MKKVTRIFLIVVIFIFFKTGEVNAANINSMFLFRNELSSGPADFNMIYGLSTDEVLFGDWDGDGKDGIAIRRGNKYHIKNTLENGKVDFIIEYGKATDEVYVGDWNGDGIDTFCVRRDNLFYFKDTLESGTADNTIRYGKTEDEVYIGDWDGDGIDGILVKRGNKYFLKNNLISGAAEKTIEYGKATDEVYVGDWNGDGIDSLAVRRDNLFYFKNLLDSGTAEYMVRYGKSTDGVYVGDWNGDRIDSLAVRRDRILASVIKVKKDGTGDYTTLKEALAKSNENSIIELYDSIKLEEEFSKNEIDSEIFYGYLLTGGRTIRGVGDITISANLDPSIYTSDQIKMASTITVKGNGKLKDVTVIGGNVRYAMHIDSRDNMQNYFENVNFVKENDGTYCQAVGGGSWSGQNHKYLNCTFETKWTGNSDIPVSYHTNVNLEKGSIVSFENCKSISNGSNYDLRLGSMKSNRENIVELINTNFKSIYVKEEIFDGSGIDYLIRGNNNPNISIYLKTKNKDSEPVINLEGEYDIFNL